jgi:hypothetical protein
MGQKGTTLTMTPTLSGRLQSRFVLLWSVGLIITLFYMLVFGPIGIGGHAPDSWKLLLILAYVNLLGIGWDLFYIYLQRFRWDADWPLAFQFGFGLVEGVLVYILFQLNWLPGVKFGEGDFWRFFFHYGGVWWWTNWCLFGPLRVIFPGWRFNGGEFITKI